MPCAPHGSSPRVLHKSPKQKAAPAFCAFPIGAAQAARGLTGALSPGAAHLLPSVSPAPVPARAGRVPAPCVSQRPSWRMSTIQNLRRSLIRDWRLFAVREGLWSLGPSLPLSPPHCLQSPEGLGRSVACELFSGLAQSLCSASSSLSFAVPQFKLVTHKSSLRLPSGHSGPVLTLSNAAGSSPFCLPLLVADAGVWGTFLLGVAFRQVICGFYLLCPSQ